MRKYMPRKLAIFLGMMIGSIIGSYIPALWGADLFSVSSILLSGLGALAGVWLGYKFSD